MVFRHCFDIIISFFIDMRVYITRLRCRADMITLTIAAIAYLFSLFFLLRCFRCRYGHFDTLLSPLFR